MKKLPPGVAPAFWITALEYVEWGVAASDEWEIVERDPMMDRIKIRRIKWPTAEVS
jgi:hypothetical protein